MTHRPVLHHAVVDWLPRRSWHADQWTADELLSHKDGQRISVVIPAQNEERTIGHIVTTVCRSLMSTIPLVDELIVVDSRSTDATAATAAAAGATVVAQDDVLPELEPMSGKGEALWKGLAASTGDIVAFVDGDLRDFSATFVTGLLGPLLTEPGVGYVKGFYQRPLADGGGVDRDGGGRVTELVARPLLDLYWPELAGFVQPLAGEYAGRRDVLTRLPFVVDYGVEVGHLIDLLHIRGLDALGQVDLGVRLHRHQPNHCLGRMSAQILLTVLSRLENAGRLTGATPPSTTLAQFLGADADDDRSPDGTPGLDLPELGRKLVLTHVSPEERPPLTTVAEARR
ncbi:MAG: glucosyl-3-phosphoglycerate synthase [Actinomycetota bacterium]|nr:glucosyl-3-phosphoglycerate synthase [Actinomycetota bacterium]